MGGDGTTCSIERQGCRSIESAVSMCFGGAKYYQWRNRYWYRGLVFDRLQMLGICPRGMQ